MVTAEEQRRYDAYNDYRDQYDARIHELLEGVGA